MITERAMLAAVHIRIWTAVKHDRKISRKVAEEHGAFESAGSYNKQLLRGADKLDALRTLAGQSVEEFLEIYPSYIEQVRPELNGLFSRGGLPIGREATR